MSDMAVPTIKEVAAVLCWGHAKNSMSRKMLNSYEYKDDMHILLRQSGAVPFTLGIAKKYLGSRLVFFSEYFCKAERIDRFQLQELCWFMTKFLSRLDVIDITNVLGGAHVKFSMVFSNTDPHLIERMGLMSDDAKINDIYHDIIWVWPTAIKATINWNYTQANEV
jgi:hypothetical protein